MITSTSKKTAIDAGFSGNLEKTVVFSDTTIDIFNEIVPTQLHEDSDFHIRDLGEIISEITIYTKQLKDPTFKNAKNTLTQLQVAQVVCIIATACGIMMVPDEFKFLTGCAGLVGLCILSGISQCIISAANDKLRYDDKLYIYHYPSIASVMFPFVCIPLNLSNISARQAPFFHRRISELEQEFDNNKKLIADYIQNNKSLINKSITDKTREITQSINQLKSNPIAWKDKINQLQEMESELNLAQEELSNYLKPKS
ncbi:MAG: hypothetical protein VX777_09690 [Chlamydiota bacterium]|nr:hypothetical protein [Chlamydiota bacterium]